VQSADAPATETSEFCKITAHARLTFKADEALQYRPSLGAERTYRRWTGWALDKGIIHRHKNRYYLLPGGVSAA
jgi:hypothetical protein